MSKRIFLQCRSLVNRSSIRRETRNGVEFIILPSQTMPDDIIMNGIFYPASETAKSFHTLNNTLAPLGHPNIDGELISANDARAIDGFYVGARNENVIRRDGIVSLDKVVNVQEALKTDRGRRLLDRIELLENDVDAQPIHTSVGVYADVIESESDLTDAFGRVTNLAARDLFFDHDAILLDKDGAATPAQGVGIAVNSQNEKFELTVHQLTSDELQPSKTKSEPKSPPKEDVMKDLIINKLREAGVSTDGLTDDQLMQEFEKISTKTITVNSDSEIGSQISAAMTAAMAPVAQGMTDLSKVVGDLQEKMLVNEKNEKSELISLIVNSDKYPGMSAEMLDLHDIKQLKSMAANCQSGYGIDPIVNGGEQDLESKYDFGAPVAGGDK